MGKKKECDGNKCKRIVKISKLKNYKGENLCFFCWRMKANVIEESSDIKRLPKDVREELKKAREKPKFVKPKKDKVKTVSKPPKIKGQKSSVKLSFYLTKWEKQILWKKYMGQGMDSLAADQKIKNDIKFLDELVTKLRNQGKEDREISVKFKEEFSKLIEVIK